MKLLALICSLCSLCSLTAAAQTNSPIVLSRLRPIVLVGESTNFIVLFTPSTNGPTLLTNNLLTLRDIPPDVPNGWVWLTVRAVTAGGESQPEIIRIDLQRPPARPTLRGILLNADEAAAPTFEDLLFHRRRQRALTTAPAPAGALIPILVAPIPPPLPNSLNLSYRQFLAREQQGLRRGE